MLLRLALLFVMLLLLMGCSGEQETETTEGAAGESGAIGQIDPSEHDLTGQPVTLAGITFQPPARWTDLGSSGMRQASYYMEPVAGETDSATVTVFYFGPEGGGSVDANIERWVAQMATGEDDDPSARAERYSFDVEGMPVHVVSVSGTYSGAMGGPMSAGTMAEENYHMLAAVVEAPEGNVFFKLTGPEQTAKEMQDGFLAMLKSVEKAG